MKLHFVMPLMTVAAIALSTSHLLAQESSTAMPEPIADIQQSAVCDSCVEDIACYGVSGCDQDVITLGGWVSGGIYANAWGATNNSLPMREMTRGTLDQAWMFAEKQADTGGCGVDWGGRVDFMFGADAQYTQCGPDHNTLPMIADPHDTGWDHGWDTSKDDNYGFAMPQLYGEVAINRLTLKAGHFFSLMGYESMPVVNNFFYSRSYAYAIEPITHMGALATYELNPCWSVTAGITNGWDNGWLNPTQACTFLGKSSMQLTDGVALDYALTFGQLVPGNDVFQQSIVLDWQINRCWEYVLQSDFNIDNGRVADTRQDYGMSQYLFYKLNECWKVGTRVEWLRAETYRTTLNGRNVFETRTGLTFGVNYSPNSNVMIRPELRWDNASGRLSNDFNDRQNTYQFAGGLDMIYKF